MGCVSMHVYTKPVAHTNKNKTPNNKFEKKAAAAGKKLRESCICICFCVYSSFFFCLSMLLYCETTTTTSSTFFYIFFFERLRRGIFFFSFSLKVCGGKKRQKHRKILFRYQLYKT